MDTESTLAMITARYEVELRDHPIPIDATDIPISYEAITREWLTLVLCRDFPGAEITSVRLGPSDEGTSSRRRIFLEYNAAGDEADLPSTVFCKATQTLKSRCQLAPNGYVRGEVLFYQQLRPTLDIEAPQALFANVNEHTFNSIIILKDIGNEVTFCDHNEPIDRARAENQVRLLATIHAKYYASDLLGSTFPFLRTWDDTFTATAANGFHEACLRGFTMGEEVIPPRLFAREAQVWPATVRSAKRHNDLPECVIHSDPHLKNWYVTASGAMGLTDWQCVGRGHWGRDLSYALSTGLDVSDRRAWERELIELYLDCLAELRVPKIAFDEAWTHYRQQLFGALAWWTGTLGQPPNAPVMQPQDSSLLFIKRMATAIDDLDALDSF